MTHVRIMLDHETSSSRGGALFPARLAKVHTSNGKPHHSTSFGPLGLTPHPRHPPASAAFRGPGFKSNGLNLIELSGFPLRVHLFRNFRNSSSRTSLFHSHVHFPPHANSAVQKCTFPKRVVSVPRCARSGNILTRPGLELPWQHSAHGGARHVG